MRKITYLLIILCLTFLTACAKEEKVLPDDKIEKNIFTYDLYHPDQNCEKFLTKEIKTEKKDITNSIINELKNVNMLRENVSLISIERTNESITLNFSEEFLTQLCEQGSSGEYYMIGSLVNTFIGAYDVKQIIILVNGEIFESGHIYYDSPLTWYE